MKDALARNMLENLEKTSSGPTKHYDDDSIIDVTDRSCKLHVNKNLIKYRSGVPFWAHCYIYSYYQLNSASVAQKEFYSVFKSSFLNGRYFDLEGNRNYAFILLFDLLKEYDSHKDKSTLESQLKILGLCYPKTKNQSISLFEKKMKLYGHSAEAFKRRESRNRYQNANYDNWRLGNKCQSKLTLNTEEVKLLNKLWYPNNKFCRIEFCCHQVVRLYLAVIAELKSRYVSEGTTLILQFTSVATVIVRRKFKNRCSGRRYRYFKESIINSFYPIIFRHCENAVRESYGYKRKLNSDTSYSEEVKSELDSKIISKIADILPGLTSRIVPPDEMTVIELNAQTKSSWKYRFEELTGNFNNPTAFVEDILEFGKINSKNPSAKNIYFEASKFMAKYDKESSLILYMHYLYHDLKSETVENRQLTKPVQKLLFKDNDQLQNFRQIVHELIHDHNVEWAVEAVPKIFETKRKKIQLDKAAIQLVQQQHSGSVILLNEYLGDEFEDEGNTIRAPDIRNDELKVNENRGTEEYHQSIILKELSFNSTQHSFLELFSKYNFSVPQLDIEAFARSKGVFKDHLIESVNEICYEILDDVLIEEADNCYTMNPECFSKIQRNDR